MAGRYFRAHAIRTPVARKPVQASPEEELRQRRPAQAHQPDLSSVLGNRAFSRMIQGGGASPLIQRYSFENTEWNMTNGVSRSGDGAQGVVFFTDGSRNPLVTKAAPDPPRETTFAALMHNKLGNKRRISAPPIRLASPAERHQIAAQIEEKAMWNQEMRDADVEQFRTGQPHVWIMGQARGKAFGSQRDKGIFTNSPLGKDRTIELLEDPEYARRMGFVTACDLFLGNGDRMDMGNLGNWMTDEEGAISLIDNFDSPSYQGLNQKAQGNWETSFLPDLKPSKYVQKGEVVYGAVTGGLPPELQQALQRSSLVSPEERKKQFAKHFAKGMADARKSILAKLAPTFGKRSRTMKNQLTQGEGGEEAWRILKRRVFLFKNLR